MTVKSGPNIVKNGLVLDFDVANLKSFNRTINLANYSEEFDRSYWNPLGVNLLATKNIVYAPNGTLTGNKIYGAVLSPSKEIVLTKHFDNLSQTVHTISCYFKAAELSYAYIWLDNGSGFGYTLELNLSNGSSRITRSNPSNNFTSFSYIVENVQNGWYRASMTATPSGSNTTINFRVYPSNTAWTNQQFGTTTFLGDGSSGIYIWGAQLEQSSSASTYLKTLTNTTDSNIYDLSGNGNTGTLNNSPTYSSLNNGSFAFNGTNTFINIPNNTALDTSTPTVEVWVKTNATEWQNGFWFEKGNVNSQYSLFQEGAYIQWRQSLSGAGLQTLTTVTANYMNTSSWYQVVATYTSGSRKLYINGIQVNSDTQSGAINTNAGGMSIGVFGGFSGSRGYYYNGNLSTCRVYNRELTASEVLQNFNATRGRYGI